MIGQTLALGLALSVLAASWLIVLLGALIGVLLLFRRILGLARRGRPRAKGRHRRPRNERR